MIEVLFNIISSFIDSVGYLGIFLLMVLESMIFPVPSEAVMPFAGYGAATGRFDFWLVVFIGSFGTIIGSLISYWIGLKGEHMIRKYHKFFLLNEHHLNSAYDFFKKYGNSTIFISRFIPVVRHLISIPAGAGRMKLSKFVLFTFLGGFMWNFILTYFGYKLGENYSIISKYSSILDLVVLTIMALVIIYIAYKNIRKHPSGK
ncbi:MAG: DedA family protein [Nanoarchaeota archaeon]